jgi:predicted DCC family thiol-disulfide oxidoreductase YuxK
MKIIFYDGDCGFCNKSVQFVLQKGKNTSIQFSAIQSEFAQAFFTEQNLPKADLSTFYFWDEQNMYSKSTGAIRVLKYIRFPYNLGQIAWLIPYFMRDFFYDQIAKRRHRLAAGFCVLPSMEERKRFLN